MGIIKQGVPGGFSGKVGTVIGSSWKGIAVMRGSVYYREYFTLTFVVHIHNQKFNNLFTQQMASKNVLF